MIDIQASVPTCFWTYDSVGAYNEDDDKIWIIDPLDRPVIQPNRISFDAPADWYDGEVTLRFEPGTDGLWEWRWEDSFYQAVRADIPTHVILTGAWRSGKNRGTFIVVSPKDETLA